jgi:hypothetical protein
MSKRSSERRAGFVVVALGAFGLCGLAACGHLGAQPEPTLAEKAERIEVYFPGQSPRCDSFEDLGMIQAVLEDETAGKSDKQNINAEHLNTVLEKLREEAAKRGASGVFLVERKHQSTGLIAIGNAVRCKGEHHSVSAQ